MGSPQPSTALVFHGTFCPHAISPREQAMDPMETPEGSGSIHMLSDPSGGGDGGPLSFARLSAPLPYLTPHPGHPPCLQLQEVSFVQAFKGYTKYTAVAALDKFHRKLQPSGPYT